MPFTDRSSMLETTMTISPVHSADLPAAVPVSPCGSETSAAAASGPAATSVTGQFRNVEDDYAVDPHVLGTGHCGSVRACTDRVTGRRYAVKSVRKGDPAAGPGGLAREVALLQEMKHENIVQLVDVYEDADYLHIVTDLCEGGELFDLIVDRAARDKEDGAPCVAEDEAARIIHQLLAAVAYLHDRDIAHRDIKPENVLFASAADGSSPVVKLVDFGLARRHARRPGAPAMRARVGTPYYMAPEVVRRRPAGYGDACDLWSVGVVAYLLLVGYPPFNGRTDAEVFAAIRRGRCHFSQRDWSGVSGEARDFVRGLLQKEPGRRPTAAQALAHPWIRTHAEEDVEMSDGDQPHDLSVEVVYHRSRSDSVIVGDIETRPVGRSVVCR